MTRNMKVLNRLYKRCCFLVTLLSIVSWCNAQTVNTGTIVVMPDTQFSTVEDFDNQSTGEFINDGEAFIYAHFNNDGIVDFSIGELGLTRFEGVAVQQLTGGQISYFYDVFFDNASSISASFELHSEISIANNAEFNEGIVKNDDFGGLFIFEDNAMHLGVDDASHVDGLVQKKGDDAFLYPIGDKQLFRYASISAPVNVSETFSAKYYFDNPVSYSVNGETPTDDAEGVITLIDNAEFWEVQNNSDVNDILLTLSWDETTTTPSNIVASPHSGIHIVRWDDARQLWVDEGGIADSVNKTVTTPLYLENYGLFTLARVNEELILPGDVVVYNGITPNGDGQNDYFIIDGIENLPNNRVQIYNRWGVKVFETEDYDTTGNVFRGYSNGRLTVSGSNQLPTGTYFYILSYDYSANGNTNRIKQAGYLYITTE